jgi:hypothetical protein
VCVGKHLICKLRKATKEEATSVNGLYDTSMSHSMSSIGGFSSVHNSMKTPKNISGHPTIQTF